MTEPSGWSRDTNWRQGSAIPERISVSLGLIPENSHSNVAIVISHDCDIVEDNLTNEPTLEVIVGQFITEADPNHTHAKSPNKLHLEFSFEDRPQFIELLSTRKKQVNKSAIAEIEPDMRISLNTNGRGIIQSWLALRYRRAVFPDSLNKHLSLLRETLQAIGKRAPQAIIGFFINFEPDQEIADPDEPYEVWIVIVYDHLSSEAEDIAEQAAQKISARFDKKFRTADGWRNVELRECVARSDIEFSLYDATTYQNFPLDHISLRLPDGGS